MKISRRDFVGLSSGILSSCLPFVGSDQSQLQKFNSIVSTHAQDANQKILVVIHLAGGNDWLNTIIPYKDTAYYRNRPNLAISQNEVLKLNEKYALHPALNEIKALHDRGEVAILLNANPVKSLSHYKAIDDLQKRFFDNHRPDLDAHYRFDLDEKNSRSLEKTMSLIAKGILEQSKTPIYHASLGGFDTHANQADKHACLLRILSQAVGSFQLDLRKSDLSDKVTTIICSEFGRSYKENDDLGTDHGYLNHALAIGSSMKGLHEFRNISSLS